MNTDNINKLIDWLKVDQGRHFHMSSWNSTVLDDKPFKYDPNKEYCGTTFCLAGTCELLFQLDNNVLPQELQVNIRGWRGRYRVRGTEYLDLNVKQGERLFLMDGLDGEGPVLIRHMLQKFDQLCKPRRAAAAIRVLEILRDTGEVDWMQAINDTGGIDPAKFVPTAYTEAQETV